MHDYPLISIKKRDGQSFDITWTDSQPKGPYSMAPYYTSIPFTIAVSFIIGSWYEIHPVLNLIIGSLASIPVGVFVFFMFYAISGKPIHRHLNISPTHITSRGSSIALNDLSRVEYGARADWDKSDRNRNHLTQIRAWEKDARFIVLAENNWTTAINHEIHRTIQDLIAEIRLAQGNKSEAPQIPATEAEAKGNFGIPDY